MPPKSKTNPDSNQSMILGAADPNQCFNNVEQYWEVGGGAKKSGGKKSKGKKSASGDEKPPVEDKPEDDLVRCAECKEEFAREDTFWCTKCKRISFCERCYQKIVLNGVLSEIRTGH